MRRSVAFARALRPKSSLDLLLAAVLALCIIRLWLMPIGSSFWVDEMGTVFVARYGAGHPSLRAAPQVAESIYYALPRISQNIVGTCEVAYRLWSVLAMAAALFFIARIAAALIHRECAWFAAFACLALHGVNYEAVDARPYAVRHMRGGCRCLPADPLVRRRACG